MPVILQCWMTLTLAMPAAIMPERDDELYICNGDDDGGEGDDDDYYYKEEYDEHERF